MIYEVDYGREKLRDLFGDFTDTMINSYIDGYMGKAWVDNIRNPKVAQIKVGVFYFFSGDSNIKEARELLENIHGEALIIVETDEWANLIKEVYNEGLCKLKRYAFERSFESFNIEDLKKNVKELSKEYELRKIDEEIAYSKSLQELTEDFTSQFDSIEHYLERGLGFCILHNGKVVSGASSYNSYKGGIEIEIDTLEEYRRKGLAKIVASALILYCIENNIYPNWDAANLESVGLAKKLGYKMKKEYNAYYIDNKFKVYTD